MKTYITSSTQKQIFSLLKYFQIFSSLNKYLSYTKINSMSFILPTPEGELRSQHPPLCHDGGSLLIHYNFSEISHKGLSVELVYRNFSNKGRKPNAFYFKLYIHPIFKFNG